MKALVTGAAGFVGRHLAAALRQSGWDVATLDVHPPADFVLNLARDRIPRLSFDVVFHLAGQSSPAASHGSEQETYAANAEGAARLARAVRRGRIVFASSAHVYGEVPIRDNPIDESRRTAPRSPYAASKLCAESLILAAWKDTVILRPFNHTGPGHSDAFVCPQIARQVARAEAGMGPRMIEVQDLSPRRDLFDVRDMVRAYILAAEKGRAGEAYNVASGKAFSIEWIVKRFQAMARVPLKVRGRRGAPSLRVGDFSKFRRATGWTPRIPLSQTLADLLEHERGTIDEFILLHHPTLLKEVEASRREYLRKGGISHEAMKKLVERRRS